MRNINSVPCLYGSIVLVFPHTTPVSVLNNALPNGTTYTEYPDCIESVLLEVKDYYSWEIDDLLTHLFTQCDLEKVQDIVATYHATVLVDIAFHHYDSYPALVFAGKNMEIRKLRANISIDPY